MNRLALIGVSHRRGGAAALERFQQQFTPDHLQCLGFEEFVLISTCNRWDLVLALPETCILEKIREQLSLGSIQPYIYADDAALEQLTRIAASLDSLNPGEDQIMKQVREAFREAQRCKTTAKTTSFAFNTALKIAKKIRRDIELAPLHTSLFSLARPELEKHLPVGSRVAIIGAGEMGALAAKTLLDNSSFEILLVNRSRSRAEQLATQLGRVDKLSCMALEDFLQAPPELAALVSATPVANLIGADVLIKTAGLRMLVDLGMPRNIHGAAAKAQGIPVLDVDTLQSAGQERRQAMMSKLAAAEQLIQEELALAMTEWTEKTLGPAIQKLREMYLNTIGDALPKQEAQALANKFAHVPMKGLRAVAKEHGLAAARTYLIETELFHETC